MRYGVNGVRSEMENKNRRIFGNAWMHRTLIKLLRRVDIRYVYRFTAVCVIPVAIELFLLNSDYTIYGIAAIVIMYLLRKHKLIGFAAAVIWLAVIMTPMEAFPMMEAFALIDLIPLYFYHGKQGRKWRPFFYAFYPVHLFVLAVILKAILH